MAAVKMAHLAGGNATEQEEDIPTPRPPAGRFGPDSGAGRGTSKGRDTRGLRAKSPAARDPGPRSPGRRPREVDDVGAASPLRARAERIAAARDGKKPRKDAGSGFGMVRLHLDVGRESGLRPQDLVGAITNEAGVTGRAVGAIEISDRHAVVEVAAEVARDVMTALRRSLIRGKRPTVRPM